LVKISEILEGADILLTPIFCDIPAWQAGTNRPEQCGRESAHKSWPASCNQSFGDFKRWRQHLQEEITSEVREKPATADFARTKD